MSRQSLVSSSVDDVESMHGFYRDWIGRQEAVLHELQRSAANPNSDGGDEGAEARLGELVERVTEHYNEYYNAKSRVAYDNVFLVFSPTWLTPFERSFLWVAGFKPGLAFQIVDKFVTDLSEEQRGRIEEVREMTKEEEKALADELARIQETVAAPPVVELARRAATAVDGELINLEAALGSVRHAMETLVECADFVRFRTVMRILSVLKAAQSVRFFTALIQFQVQIRRWGTQRESSSAAAQ
uniref:DOG1 domain-containing protein n=1 Tax=Kalanchoe fedtschenkoi TaxID=63787 RepID=A0A7N0TPD1_KALFE